MNLYKSILGARWSDADVKVRNSHLDNHELRAECVLDIVGPSNVFGRMIARIVSLPGPMQRAPVTLVVRDSPEGEIWERIFPDCNLRSVQSKSDAAFLVDRFRFIAFHFQLEVADGAIIHHHRETFLIIGHSAIRLPRWLSPTVVSHESPDEVEFASRIHVTLSMPIIGHLLTYAGIVRPVKSEP